MIRNPVHLTLALLAVLGLVALPAASNLEAQGSKGTIKIATQSPLSGGQAALGEGIKLGAQLAIENFKGNLEKMGYKVDLVPFDDQAKPDVGVANAKNIIADKDILAVIGHLNSGVAIPSSEVYKEVSLVMISPANTNPVVTDRGYLNVNRVCGRDDVQGVVGSEFAHATMKAKSVYVIHDKTQYGQGVAEFFKTDAEKKGIKVLGFEGTEEKSNFDPIITPIKAKNPDVIYFGGRPRLGPAEGQGVRGGVQEEVRQEPRAVRCRGLRRGHRRAQGRRSRGQERQGEPRRRGDGGPKDEAQRHHRRHRVRLEGRPEKGPLLRVAGGERRPGEVGRQQDRQATDHQPARKEVVGLD